MAVQRLSQSYARLAEHYPLGELAQVKALIGGKVNASWVTNSCAIRLSRALNYGAFHIPYISGLSVVSGEDKLWYAYRVREVTAWLKRLWGRPQVVLKYANRLGAPEALLGKKGILVVEVPFSDATGHMTLWDGQRCIDDSDYFDLATQVMLWEVPD